jgi:hypothetical protein
MPPPGPKAFFLDESSAPSDQALPNTNPRALGAAATSKFQKISRDTGRALGAAQIPADLLCHIIVAVAFEIGPGGKDVCDDGHVATPGAMIAGWRQRGRATKTDCQRGHLTDTQVTYTYTYTHSARNAAGPHVHPPTPAPNHTQIPIPSPIQHTMAAERAVGAVCSV